MRTTKSGLKLTITTPRYWILTDTLSLIRGPREYSRTDPWYRRRGVEGITYKYNVVLHVPKKEKIW